MIVSFFSLFCELCKFQWRNIDRKFPMVAIVPQIDALEVFRSVLRNTDVHVGDSTYSGQNVAFISSYGDEKAAKLVSSLKQLNGANLTTGYYEYKFLPIEQVFDPSNLFKYYSNTQEDPGRFKLFALRKSLRSIMEIPLHIHKNLEFDIVANENEATIAYDWRNDKKSTADPRLLYSGLKFEQKATAKSDISPDFHIIVKSSYGNLDVFLDAEVDAYRDTPTIENFIELKTHPKNQKIDHFLWKKLVAAWCQTWFIGTRNVIVGFRKKLPKGNYSVASSKTFKTADIPKIPFVERAIEGDKFTTITCKKLELFYIRVLMWLYEQLRGTKKEIGYLLKYDGTTHIISLHKMSKKRYLERKNLLDPRRRHTEYSTDDIDSAARLIEKLKVN